MHVHAKLLERNHFCFPFLFIVFNKHKLFVTLMINQVSILQGVNNLRDFTEEPLDGLDHIALLHGFQRTSDIDILRRVRILRVPYRERGFGSGRELVPYRRLSNYMFDPGLPGTPCF